MPPQKSPFDEFNALLEQDSALDVEWEREQLRKIQSDLDVTSQKIDNRGLLELTPEERDLVVQNPAVQNRPRPPGGPQTAQEWGLTERSRRELFAPPTMEPKPLAPTDPSLGHFGGALENIARAGSYVENEIHPLVAKGTIAGVLGTGKGIGSGLEAVGQATGFEGVAGLGNTLSNLSSLPDDYLKPPEEIAGSLMEDWRLAADPKWWAYNLGSGAGSMAGFIGPGMLAANVAGRIGQAAAWTDRTRKLVQAIAGPAAGAAVESFVQAGLDRDDALERGKDPEEANMIAAKSFAANMALLGVTAGAGYVLPNIQQAGMAAKLIAGGLGESGQEMGQEVISNVLGEKPLSQGLPEAGIIGGLMGVGGGAAFDQHETADPMKELQDLLDSLPGEPPPNLSEFQGQQPEGFVSWDQTQKPPPPVTPVAAAPVAPVTEAVTPPVTPPVTEPVTPVAPPVAPPPPVTPVVPPKPPSINPNLSDDVIAQLRGAGIGDHIIRSYADEEEARYALGEATKKPKVPLRPKVEQPPTGIGTYIERDKQIQAQERGAGAIESVTTPVDAELSQLSDTELQEKLDALVVMDDVGMGEPEVRARVESEIARRARPPAPVTPIAPAPPEAQTEGGQVDVSDDQADTGQGEGAGAAGRAGRIRVEESTPLGRETPNQRATRRTGHYDTIFGHTLEAARRHEPEIDEPSLRREFNERVDLAEELFGAERASGRNPRDLLKAIAEYGGLLHDKDLGGELDLLKETAGPFGIFGGVQGIFRKDGKSIDDMVTALRQDDRFQWIESKNELLEALDEVGRHGARNTEGVFPGTDWLAKYAGVIPEEAWWSDKVADAHVDETTPAEGEGANVEDITFEDEKPAAPVTAKMPIAVTPTSHVDHGLSPAHMTWLQEHFGDRTGFFAETVTMPEHLAPLENALYGPLSGDAPISEADVRYAKRGERANESRLVNRAARPTRQMTVIAGPGKDGGMVLYTAFGGPLALQEPGDPNVRDRAASEAFWKEHALAEPVTPVAQEPAIEKPEEISSQPKVDVLDTGEAQPRLPGDVGGVREQNVVTPKIEAPFTLDRETEEKPQGKQGGLLDATANKELDDLIGDLDSLLTPMAPRRKRGGILGALGMAEAAPEPKVTPEQVQGAIKVFKALGAAGYTDFNEAIDILIGKKGEAWVRPLAKLLKGAWSVAARTNPNMGPPGDVEAILAARKPHAGTGATGHPEGTGTAGGTETTGGTGTGAAPDLGDTAVSGGREPDAPVVGSEGRPVSPDPSKLAPKTASIDQQREAATGSEHFAPYVRRTEQRGAEHPKLIVEAKALAGVPYPPLTTAFTSPHVLEAVKAGRVSVQQAEQALAAVQANLGGTTERTGGRDTSNYQWAIRRENDIDYVSIYDGNVWDAEHRVAQKEIKVSYSPVDGVSDRFVAVAKAYLDEIKRRDTTGGHPGHGYGYVIADAVGVGKSRELALVALELMHRAKEEGRELRLLFMTLRDKNIEDFHGELAYVASGRDLGGRNLDKQDELSDDLGEPGTVPFDVVNVKDEKGKPKQKPHALYLTKHVDNFARYKDALMALNLHGLIADEAHGLKRGGTAKAAAWQLMHALIYKNTPRNEQVFVYSSATPVQDVQDFKYLYGLRLWPIDGFTDWMRVITGTADTKTANKVLQYIQQGGPDTGLDNIISQAGAGRVVGESSRIRMTEAEAEQIPRELKALGRMSARDLWREGTDYDIHEATLSKEHEAKYNRFTNVARQIFAAYGQFGAINAKNAHGQLVLAAKRMQMEPWLDEAIKLGKKYVASGHQVVFSVLHRSPITDLATRGNLRAAIDMIKDTKKDVNGNDIPNEEAIAEKERLRTLAGTIGGLEAPGEAIKAAFGADEYAEVVGGMNDAMKAAVKQFQEGERAVIMITAAGSTGINLQQKKPITSRPGAQGRRVFITIQNEWSAINELQRMGRVDRADSYSPPIIRAISFGSALEKRFLGSIAARLKSVGALAKGGVKSVGALGGEDTKKSYEDFDFSDDLSLQAVRLAFKNAPADMKAQLPWEGDELPTTVNTAEVQKALMFMPINRANQFWHLFVQARDELKAAGYAENEDAKTKQTSGRVLREFELGDKLTLYQMMSEDGEKFGLLTGVVMPHMPRLREALSDGSGNPRRAYRVVKGHDGKLMAGLDIKWSRIERVAAAFGQDISTWEFKRPSDVYNALDAGEHIPLNAKNEKGTRLILRKSIGEHYLVDNATLKMRAKLEGAGAKLDAKTNTWRIPDKTALRQFLIDFRPAASDDSHFGFKKTGDPSYFGMAQKGARQVPAQLPPIAQIPPRRGPPVQTKPEGQMSRRQMREYLEQRLQLPIRVRGYSAKAWGLYYLQSRGAAIANMPEIVRVKIAELMPVIIHETGHHIHERLLGIDPTDARWKQELLNVGVTTTLPSYNERQKLAEGQAEFTRHWMMDRASVFAMAPNYTAEFERTLSLPKNKDLQETLYTLQKQFSGFVALDDHLRLQSSISFDVTEKPDLGVVPRSPFRRAWQAFRREVTHDLAHLEYAVNQMAGTKPLPFSEDAHRLALAARGYADKAREFMKSGVRRNDGKFIYASGLEYIFNNKAVQKAPQEFATYLVARRAVELHDRPLTKDVRDPVTGKIKKVPVPQVNEYAIDRQWAVNTVAKYGSQEFKDAADMLYKWQDAMLDYAIENGAISHQQAAAMRELNKHYVPFQRVMDAFATQMNTSAADTYANRVSHFRTIKGSGREIINPLESIVKNAFLLTNLVEHNNAMRALAKQAKVSAGSGKFAWLMPVPRNPVTFNLSKLSADIRAQLKKNNIDVPTNLDLDRMVTVWMPTTFAHAGKRYLSYLENGKRQFMEVNSKPLFDTLATAGPKAVEPLLRWLLVKPTQLLKSAITRTPGFILRNFTRDPWVAFIQSKHGFIPVVDHLYGLAHVMGRTDLFQTYMTSGGGQATLSSLSRESMDRTLRKMLGQKAATRRQRVMDVVASPFDFLGAISEAIELAPRIAEHRLAIQQKGMRKGVAGRMRHFFDPVDLTTTDEDTLRAAAEAGKNLTLNFQKGGRATRIGNLAIPFLNPTVRGIAQMGETLSPKNVKEDPEVVARLMVLPLISMLLWALNHDDEDYRKIEQWERDSYWHFKAPWTDSGWIRFPKPFEYASLVANTVEAGLDYYYKEDPEALERGVRQIISTRDVTGEGIATSLVLSLMPVLALPWIENAANYKFFFGRPVSSMYQGDRDFPELDYNRWTSHTARYLGEWMGMSPAKLENLIYGYTGNMGKGFLTAGDTIADTLGLIPNQPSRGLAGVPGLGTFYTEPGLSSTSRAQRRLYDVNEKLTGVISDQRDLGELAAARVEGAAPGLLAPEAQLGKAETPALQALAERLHSLGANVKSLDKMIAQRTERADILVNQTLIRQGVDALRDERKHIDAVLEDQMMSGREKREKLDAIYERMDWIARTALGEPIADPATGKLPVQAR